MTGRVGSPRLPCAHGPLPVVGVGEVEDQQVLLSRRVASGFAVFMGELQMIRTRPDGRA